MLVLGIETTCDETACAVVRDGHEILSSVISSQIDLHNEYGGVVPELACRRHVDILIPVIDEALAKAQISLEAIDLIAVAHEPGLIGALLIGLNAAKSISLALNKPLIGVNHVEAHLYAAYMSQSHPIAFPCIGAVLSGGHTNLVQMHAIGHYTLLGQTVDDAIGEAFDKVAKILGLPYPGGPQIEALARHGNSKKYPFKPGNVKGRPLDFSFSGLKTAVLYTIKGQNLNGLGKEASKEALSEKQYAIDQSDKCDIAASFQQAALRSVVDRALIAARQCQCDTMLLGGGVTNNQALRRMLSEAAPQLKLLWPSAGLSLDNAAMIAGLGYHHYRQRGPDTLHLQAQASKGITQRV